MSNNSLNRVGELVRGVFELLWNKPEGLPASEIIALLPEIVQFSENETGYSPLSNMPRYERVVRLATISLAKVGWLVKTDSGRWIISESGRDASKRHANARDFYAEALRLSEGARQTHPELILFYEHTREKAWKMFQQYMQEKTVTDVRRLVMDLFAAMKYHVQWIAPAEKNRGQIDMIVTTEAFGMGKHRIMVQVKHTGQAVTMEGIRSFMSVLGPDDFGLVFSTSGFTSEVMSELVSPAYRRLNAMKPEKFLDLWIQNFASISQDAHARLPLKAVYLLAPVDL